MRLPAAFVALSLISVFPPLLEAQQFYNVGQEVNGKINVELRATINDGADVQAVSLLVLTLYRSATDSLQLKTDEAGVLRFAIAPGSYRLSATTPLPWRGRSYRWNIPLVVRRGMGIVELTNANATSSKAEYFSRRDAASSDAIAFKDPALATILSILIPGSGQMYAGKSMKGALVIVGLFGSLGVAASVHDSEECSQTSSNGLPPVRTCTGGNPPAFNVALVTAAASYLFGIVTAGEDARDYNRSRHRQASLRPTIDRREGGFGLGLAVSY